MSKNRSRYICQECSLEVLKWLGHCPECGAWNSFQEVDVEQKNKILQFSHNASIPQKISQISDAKVLRYKTNIMEFDRVLGGGVTAGSLVLLGGEPGVGKSTLLAEVCARFAALYSTENILYVSGEESSAQVSARFKRLKIKSENIYLLHETNWQNILEAIKKLKPRFFILDSIQTTASCELESTAGSSSQLKEIIYELMNQAKANSLTCFVVGHVTKEGFLAGPKMLEHMVDTVLQLEGDTVGENRILKAVKNRFGEINEVGLFKMKKEGLVEMANPAQIFVDSSFKNAFGRSITCIVEGRRSLLIEIQALVAENRIGITRRVAQGIEQNRFLLLIAIADKYFNIPLSANDIYLNVVGGLRLNSRESDLCILASLLSSYYGKALDSQMIFLGEVGLTGEVRPISMVEARLKEIEQMNYKAVVLSKSLVSKFKHKFKIHMVGIECAAEITPLFSA